MGKQKNDLKDFLSATATIRKEAKKEESKKEEKRDQQPEVKKQESKNEEKPVQKRRLSSNSEVEEAEPKSKIPKLKVESDCEPEVKKLKSEPMTPMGRIPKLAKKEPERKKLQPLSALWTDQKTDPNCPRIPKWILNQNQDTMIDMVTDCPRLVIRARIERGI